MKMRRHKRRQAKRSYITPHLSKHLKWSWDFAAMAQAISELMEAFADMDRLQEDMKVFMEVHYHEGWSG